ncbi:uncharacterized protein [Dysidea avara]|uniref:uncharacterized protein n=1 Tax=Dysidea avara TaxID=196820 RepID=UPI0033166B35
MMLNMIIAIELCLLQLGNLQDEDYTEDVKSLRDVLQTCHERLLTAYEIIISYFNKPMHVQVKVDLAKKPEQTGTQVIETVVDRIGRSSIFGNDFGYIRRICWVETKDGTDEKTFRPGYHGGLWQVDEAVFHKTQDTSSYPILLKKYDQIKSAFDIDWLYVKWVDLRMPLHSGLAAWLYMFTREEKIPLNIQEQADHWKRNYRPKAEVTADDFVKKTVDLEKMKSDVAVNIALDLYIVLDSSKSIGRQSYEEAKKFLGDLVSGFTIGKNNVRVGLVIYGSEARLIFGLKHSYNKDEILSSIQSVEYLKSFTATGDAIRLMTTTGFTEEHGVRASDRAIPRVAIVLTDGESDNGQNVLEAAQSARNQSIEMLAFGIGSGINESELLEIAGSQDRVFRIDTFTNIDDVRAQITRGCRKYAFVKATIDTTYNGEVSAEESRFFEFPITKDGITFQLEVTTGKLALYGSYTNPNPSSVWFDHKIQGIQRRKVKAFIPCSDWNEKDGSTGTFYCSLVGEKDSKFFITALGGTQ